MKIYLDMDGVLADFDRGVKEFCGITLIDQSIRTKEQTKELWDKVRTVDHFYDRLELMPGAMELFELSNHIPGAECEILTGIPRPVGRLKSAAEDKVSWAHRLLDPNIKVNTVFRREKKNFCTGKDCILIDDLQMGIDAWEEVGGTGILYRNARQACEELQDYVELFAQNKADEK